MTRARQNLGQGTGTTRRVSLRESMAVMDVLPKRLKAFISLAEGKWSPEDMLRRLMNGETEDEILAKYAMADRKKYAAIVADVYDQGVGFGPELKRKLAAPRTNAKTIADKYIPRREGRR